MKHLYAKMTFRIILISFLALILIGCGESGSPGGSSGIGITSSIILSAGDTELPADGVSSTTISVSMQDSAGSAVNEMTSVVLKTNLGTFRNGSAEYKIETIDESGSVSAQLIAPLTTGTAEVTAASNGVTQKVEVKFVDPEKVGTISLTTGSDSIPADGTSQVSIIATVYNADGDEIEGAAVTFKTSIGEFVEANLLPGFDNRDATAFTDVDGDAAVMLISGKTIGTATILASVNGLNATTSVTFTADAAQAITLRAAPSVVQPAGSSTLIATLEDANGNPVEGETVVFSQTINTSNGTLSTISATSNVNGEAEAAYTTGKNPGTDMFQAALGSDLGMTAETAILVDPGAIVVNSITVVAGADELVADGLSQVLIRATVTDIDDSPALSKTVNFSTTAGTLSSLTATTDENGFAEVMLQATTISGPVTVRAETDGFIGEVSVEFVPGEADHILMYGVPDTVPPGGDFATAAIIQDKYDNRIDDQRLKFEVRLAGFSEIVDTAEMTADQAEDGVFRFDWTAATAYGSGNLEITAMVNNGVSKTVTIVVDETATIVGSIDVTAGAEYIEADGTSSVLIRATVLDSDGQPASGITVDFSTTLGSLSSQAKETDQNGVADVMLKAGTDWGTATVKANANGFWGEVEILLTSLKAGGVSITTMPRIISPGQQATVIAELKDANGNPVADELLYFDIFENKTGGSLGVDCSCPSCISYTLTATTDINGRAIVTYCPGDNNVQETSVCACCGDRIRVTLASDSSVLDETCISVGVSTGSIGYMTLTSTDNSLPADGISSTAVLATVFDTAGFAMPEGTPITFTITPTGLGTFPGGLDEITLSTLDDAGGIITSLIAGGTAGVVQITAVSGGVSQLLYILLVDDTGTDVTVGSITMSADPDSLPSDGASSSAITVAVFDTGGNPVPGGTPVVFETTLGTFANTTFPTIALATDDNGTVTTSLIAGSTDGVAFVTATAGFITQAIEVSIVEELTEGITVTAGAASLVADGASETTVRATVVDFEGNPQTGVDVTFITTLGTVDGVSQATETTNASGFAEVSLQSVTTTGIATITATANGFSDSVDVEFVASTPDNIELLASCLVLTPGGGECGESTCENNSILTVRVTDTLGNPISGESITFFIEDNQSGATLSATSAETDINGQASVTYTAGGSNGDDTVTVRSVADASVEDSVVIVVGGQVTLVAASDPIVADGATTSIFTATVRDNAGNSMEGVPVIFKNITGTAAGVYNGTGPDVTPNFYHSGGLITFKMTHTGTSNFIVHLRDYQGNIVEYLKNVIGPITGETSVQTVDAGVYFIEVANADGSWTIEVTSADPEFDTLPTLLSATTNASGQASYTYTSNTSVQSVKIGVKAGCVQTDATIQQIVGPVATVSVISAPSTVTTGGLSTITASVTDAFNNPISGVTVNFLITADNSVGATLDSATAVTGSTGEAFVYYTAGAGNAVDSISATAALTTSTTTVTVDSATTPSTTVGSIEIEAGAASIPADGSSQVTIRATVKDPTGEVMEGVVVEFTTTSGAITSPVTTEATGIAQTMLTSSSFSGTATVRAIADGFWANVNVLFLPGVPQTITLSPAPSTVNPGGISSVTATLLDDEGNRVPNETLTFLLQRDTSGASLSAPSAVTNINGEATVTYTAGATETLLLPDRIRVRSVTDTFITAMEEIDVSGSAMVVGSVTVTSGAPSIVANGTSTTAIRAMVLDIDANPYPNFTVDFATTLGTLAFDFGTTDENGNAQVTLTSAASPGTAVVTADADGFVDDVEVAFLAGVPAAITLIADPQSVNQGETSTVTATLLDASVPGNPLSGETIAFSFGTTNNSGATLSAPSAVTNINGEATVTYTAGDTGPVTDTITATSVTDTSVDNTVDIDVIGGNTASQILVRIVDTTLDADGVSQTTAVVTALTALNQVVEGAQVTFAIDGGSITSPHTTDANGQAIATITSDRVNRPLVTVTASSTGAPDATATMSFVGVTITLTATPDTLLTTDSSIVTALLNDAAGNPIAGRGINFSENLGGTITATAITNASGLASVLASSGIAGVQTITATDDPSYPVAGVEATTSITYGSYLLQWDSTSTTPINIGNSTSVFFEFLNSGSPVIGATINFSSTLGTLAPVALGVTNASGIAEVVLTAGTQTGRAVIDASTVVSPPLPGTTFTAQTTVLILADTATKIVMKPVPGIITTDTGVSTINAVVYDADDNVVPYQTVYFRINDAPGGGEYLLSSAQTTDITGTAEVQFFAGGIPSNAIGDIEIEASTVFPFPTLPTPPMGLCNLTIAGPVAAVSVSVNLQELPAPALTQGHLEVGVSGIATDVFGNPVADGTQIFFSVSSIGFDEDRDDDYLIDCWDTLGAFGFGTACIPGNVTAEPFTAGTLGVNWFSDDTNQDGGMYNIGGIIAPSEDIPLPGMDIGNGILDDGEDINDNGVLDPVQGVSITSPVLTVNGVATSTIYYPMSYANNIKVRITAEAGGVSNFYDYVLLCTESMADAGTCGDEY